MRTLLFLFAVLLFSPGAYACICKQEPVTEKAAEHYELIFLGKVDAVSGGKTQFTVQKIFRGKCFPSTEVEYDSTSDCQMSFAPGETWLIYATYEAYGKPEVSLCSFSRKQFSSESDDYNTVWHGKTFAQEAAWLEKTFGVQPFSEKTVAQQQHHENILPKGYETLWYLGGGLIALLAFYYLSKKFLR